MTTHDTSLFVMTQPITPDDIERKKQEKKKREISHLIERINSLIETSYEGDGMPFSDYLRCEYKISNEVLHEALQAFEPYWDIEVWNTPCIMNIELHISPKW